MRYGLWGLAALFLGAFGAHFLLEDRGYVLINFRSYVIEMSVPALVLVLVALYACIRLGVRIWRAPRRLGAALADQRHRRAGAKLTRGLIHMTEGDFGRSERLLTEGLKGGDAPLVNYLMAARAAQLQGSRERRNEWLKLAYETLPDAEVAVLLTQAELQVDDGELERALATLERVQEKYPDHPAGLMLLARTRVALGERDKLVELLPRLARARLPVERLGPLAAQALETVIARPDLTDERYDAIWSPLPRPIRQLPAVARLNALALNRLGKGEIAVRELKAALKRRWAPELVRAFGEVKADDPLKQLKTAESWLKERPEDSALLLTTARLCMTNELWGKARSYLESSLALDPSPETYALYGELLEALGESDQAALAFRSGLGIVSRVDAHLPALAAPGKLVDDEPA
jgi:HemY protein